MATSEPASRNESEADFDFDLDELGLDDMGLGRDEFEPQIAVIAEEVLVEVDPVEESEADVSSEKELGECELVASEESEESYAAAAESAAAGNWRALFERELKSLEVDARVEMARSAGDERLRAFCFDPSPRVIAALLENQLFGLEHARQVASHHPSGAGLDALGRHSQFVRDRQVQRLLFRNQQTPESLLHRIFLSYRLAEVYLLTAGREATERVRATARRLLRRKFPQSSAEERVALILKTEGRCLPQLVGVALGGRATSLMCRRPVASTLLIRNLARWPSTPPPVLQHLARQPSVRRSPVLRAELLRHPNAPSHLQTELRS